MGFNWRDLDLGKRIILAGTGVLLLATLFPPWAVEWFAPKGGGSVAKRLEYAFLFAPPVEEQYTVSLDVTILVAEWLVIAIVTGALYFVFRPKP